MLLNKTWLAFDIKTKNMTKPKDEVPKLYKSKSVKAYIYCQTRGKNTPVTKV